MFLGTYTPKLDDKGRLTLPAKFRDALAGGLMVTKSQDHSLAVYPRTEFEALARRASGCCSSEEAARFRMKARASGLLRDAWVTLSASASNSSRGYTARL